MVTHTEIVTLVRTRGINAVIKVAEQNLLPFLPYWNTVRRHYLEPGNSHPTASAGALILNILASRVWPQVSVISHPVYAISQSSIFRAIVLCYRDSTNILSLFTCSKTMGKIVTKRQEVGAMTGFALLAEAPEAPVCKLLIIGSSDDCRIRCPARQINTQGWATAHAVCLQPRRSAHE